MPGGGAGAVGHAAGHGLEDDVDHVGVDALLSEAAQEHPGQLAAAHAGDEGLLHGGHGPVGAGLGLMDAGQLVVGLVELDRPHGVGRVDNVGGGQNPGAAHGPSHQVDADAPAAGRAAQDRVELGTQVGSPLINVRPNRGMVLDIQPARVAPQQIRPGVVGQHHCDRPVGRSVGHIDPFGQAVGGVSHMRPVQQHQGVEPVGSHLRLELGVPLPPQPPHIKLQHWGSGSGRHALTLPQMGRSGQMMPSVRRVVRSVGVRLHNSVSTSSVCWPRRGAPVGVGGGWVSKRGKGAC